MMVYNGPADNMLLVEELRRIHSALDDVLGDTDISYVESDEELRQVAPLQWAAMELSFLISRLDGTQ